jgi:hypothetical protein
MPYILDGKSISPDAAFTHDGIQYPAGWIRRVSEDSRQSIGLFWQADPPMHDQRFWWGYDQAGALIPKDLDQLKDTWTAQVKHTAGQLLAASDWVIIRSIDPVSGREPGEEVLEERKLIRDKSNVKEQAIEAAESVEELAAYLTSAEFFSWSDEVFVEQDSEDEDGNDTVIFSAGSTVSGVFTGTTFDAGTDSVSFDL